MYSGKNIFLTDNWIDIVQTVSNACPIALKEITG